MDIKKISFVHSLVRNIRGTEAAIGQRTPGKLKRKNWQAFQEWISETRWFGSAKT